MARYKLSVVIPVYNSAPTLDLLVSRIVGVVSDLDLDYEIVLIDDRSADDSWNVLKRLKSEHPDHLKIASLLKNSGQHNALLCGFSLSDGDVVITMDDDLQNPPEEIPRLLECVERGFDLVIGSYEVKQHAALRNVAGAVIDWIIRRCFNLPKEFQLTSFRAAKRSCIDRVCEMTGVFPYITCMLLASASTYTNVIVRHEKRVHGSSQYRLRKSLLLALNLVFSFSTYPLKLVSLLCALFFVGSFGLATKVIYDVYTYGASVPGWASTMVLMSFSNGMLLFCLLIFGIYIMRCNQVITKTHVSYNVRELYE